MNNDILTAALVILSAVIVWLTIEVRKVYAAVAPLANSNIAQILARA